MENLIFQQKGYRWRERQNRFDIEKRGKIKNYGWFKHALSCSLFIFFETSNLLSSKRKKIILRWKF